MDGARLGVILTPASTPRARGLTTSIPGFAGVCNMDPRFLQRIILVRDGGDARPLDDYGGIQEEQGYLRTLDLVRAHSNMGRRYRSKRRRYRKRNGVLSTNVRRRDGRTRNLFGRRPMGVRSPSMEAMAGEENVHTLYTLENATEEPMGRTNDVAEFPDVGKKRYSRDKSEMSEALLIAKTQAENIIAILSKYAPQ